MELFTTLVQILDSTVRLSVPLLLACLAGLYSERSGIFDIGLEGKMLGGAFAAAAAAVVFGNPWIALLFALLASLSLAIVHAFASITVKFGDTEQEPTNDVGEKMVLTAIRATYSRLDRTPPAGISASSRNSTMEPTPKGTTACARRILLAPINDLLE